MTPFNTLIRSTAGLVALVGLAAAVGTPAWATPTGETLVCTDAPRAQWMTEVQARARFGSAQYLLVKFKESTGNCYEFYAVAHDGSVVEAYVNPVTGEAVRQTRVAPLVRSAPSGAAGQRGR